MVFKLGNHIKLSLALLMTMTIAGSCTAATNPTTVKTQYQNSSENFANPERGFYKPFDPEVYDPNSPLQLSDMQQARKDGMSTIRRYYLLENFRDKPISQSYLDMVAKDFETSRKAGVKMVIRFVYNWLGGGPDAPKDIILSHLDQLKPVLQANYDVIAYMEAGFIGKWGEWHSSSNNLVDSWSRDVTEDAKKILFKILSVLPKERMVAIRYSKQKKQIFNNNDPLTAAEAFNGSDRARVGHDNAGFRAGIDDAGTYDSADPTYIDQQKAWLNSDTKYVVQGGEPAWASDPPEYDDCAGALSDFARMHWSGMNIHQADAAAEPLYQGWKDQGCMEEIKQRLGYRFRLVSSYIPDSVKPASTFSMSFKVANDGWASPYNPRNLEVILRNRQTGKEYYMPVPEAVRMWMPDTSNKVNIVGGIPSNMPPGEYQVLLNLPDPTSRLYNRPEYSIRLANQNVWEASTGYNSLLRTVVVEPNAGGDTYSGTQFFKPR